MRGRGDVRRRQLERLAPTDPSARLRAMHEARRHGETVPRLDYLATLQDTIPDPRERLRVVLQIGKASWDARTDMNAEAKRRHDDLDARVMAALRRLNKRIKRSKRKNLDDLAGWAAEVVGQESVDKVTSGFRPERDAIISWHGVTASRIGRIRNQSSEVASWLAWHAEARHGEKEVLYKLSRTDTYRTVGLGAESYAKSSATSDAIFLASQGFRARAEYEPGELIDRDHRPWASSTYRFGHGWRTFVMVEDEFDAEILRVRQDGWTYPSHVVGGSPGDVPREWSEEKHQALHWDPAPSRPRDCCPMTVEAMKAKVAKGGFLRPSWIPPQPVDVVFNPPRGLVARAQGGDRRAQVELLRRSVSEGSLSQGELNQLAASCDAVALEVTGGSCGDQGVLAAAGKRARFGGDQAEALIRAHYAAQGFEPDPRSRGRAMISPDGKSKIVIRSRSWQLHSGGRGNWKKTGSGSKVKLAEKLAKKAKSRRRSRA